MAVEILTVGLDEATMTKLADMVAERLRSVTPVGSETRRTQTAEVSAESGSGWESEPSQASTPASDSRPAQAADSAPAGGSDSGPAGANDLANPQRRPRCGHGDMRFVKGGFSQRSGKGYPAFWGCSSDKNTPREQKCEGINAQEWFNRVANEG